MRMNGDRQIKAESRHNFHFLPHFNSKVTEVVFTKFLHDVELLVPLLMRVHQDDIALRFETPEQRVKTVNFDVCKNRPK